MSLEQDPAGPRPGPGVPRGAWEGTPPQAGGRAPAPAVGTSRAGPHLQKAKGLLQVACRTGLLPGVSGLQWQAGVCEGRPQTQSHPPNSPGPLGASSRRWFPRPRPKSGSTESLRGTGLNNKVAGNKNTGWHFGIWLPQDDPRSASSKNPTQPEDAKDSGRPAPPSTTTTTSGKRDVLNQEHILRILLPLHPVNQKPAPQPPAAPCPQPPRCWPWEAEPFLDQAVPGARPNMSGCPAPAGGEEGQRAAWRGLGMGRQRDRGKLPGERGWRGGGPPPSERGSETQTPVLHHDAFRPEAQDPSAVSPQGQPQGWPPV